MAVKVFGTHLSITTLNPFRMLRQHAISLLFAVLYRCLLMCTQPSSLKMSAMPLLPEPGRPIRTSSFGRLRKCHCLGGLVPPIVSSIVQKVQTTVARECSRCSSSR